MKRRAERCTLQLYLTSLSGKEFDKFIRFFFFFFFKYFYINNKNIFSIVWHKDNAALFIIPVDLTFWIMSRALRKKLRMTCFWESKVECCLVIALLKKLNFFVWYLNFTMLTVYRLFLSYGAECSMWNIFQVSHIFQLILRASRRVK